ncbi:MAG: cyclic nucleotide-binding domain-containing protein [Chloroflexi bacterium]|jgi:signal transduction histidine kinase|nr:cyclic nucleotide-binding domain-containing protein [Chloroflexota bacterium]MBT7082581.1 cyclic nucleotide-binding domain-containing protein [Chloroflexota bacterium]MBT7289126.1 cyclic nucleotide-binding domain-containing protein [Chloroflexota bacterium]
MQTTRSLLAQSRLFEGLADDELNNIVGFCSKEVYAPGTTIFSEGEPGNKLYIVEDGKVVLDMALRIGSGSGRNGSIDVITKGQVFGWWGGESYIQTMTARCVEKTKVIAIDAKGLWQILEQNDRIGYRVMKKLVGVISSRLLNTRDTLAHVLSIASHDLKAPLAAVESYNKVMADGYAGEVTEKQKNMLTKSSARITGLLNLIDNILDISRVDASELKTQTIPLLELVDKTREVIAPLAEEKGITFEVIVPEQLIPIKCSPYRLHQVITNLLGNAVKFTSQGGTITLKIGMQDDRILVEVIDTGLGIPSEELPQIFGDFFRGVKVDSDGAGLGLAISKKIVEAHGGKIWVESPNPASGVGSKFSFILPAIQLQSEVNTGRGIRV